MSLAEKLSHTTSDLGLEIDDNLSIILEQSSISDRLGIIGSSLCLVHCLVLPFLLPLFTSANSVTHTQGLESWFHGIIFPALLIFAVSAFSRGYKLHHSKYILALGMGGISIISLGLVNEYIPSYGLVSPESLTSLGSIILVSAHVLNVLKIRATKPHIHSASCGCGSKANSLTKVVSIGKYQS